MIALARLYRALHAVQGMLAQQLQDPHEPAGAWLGAVMGFECGAERGEAGRELPVPVHGRVIEGAGLVLQRRQIVDRLEDRRPTFERPLVRCDRPARRDDDHSVDVSLDRHHLERERPRHAVSGAVESDRLVLVHAGRRANHTGVKADARQRRGRGLFFGEAVADLEWPEQRLHDAVALGLTALAKQRR